MRTTSVNSRVPFDLRVVVLIPEIFKKAQYDPPKDFSEKKVKMS